MVAFFVYPNGCIKISVDLFVDCYIIFGKCSSYERGLVKSQDISKPLYYQGFQHAKVRLRAVNLGYTELR